MDSSVSPQDEIWFLRVCHHISNAVYQRGYDALYIFYFLTYSTFVLFNVLTLFVNRYQFLYFQVKTPVFPDILIQYYTTSTDLTR